jgi:hypothetical protein
MATARPTTAQQRDARELARTRPADPYRGALTDPFAAANQAASAAPQPTVPAAVEASPVTAVRGTPSAATLAGIIAIVLGIVLALFGMLLLTILGLQNDYGAPDRSYYSGTDSGYVVLALVDFGLAGLAALGGITFLGGKVLGRVAITVAGWASLGLAVFWLERGTISAGVPIVVAIAAAAMLALGYQRSVTRWLGVLPAPQPE